MFRNLIFILSITSSFAATTFPVSVGFNPTNMIMGPSGLVNTNFSSLNSTNLDGGVLASGLITTRNLSARFLDTVSIKDLGVVGNGSDEYIAITNAIQKAFLLGKGLYFPSGTYMSSKAIIVTNENFIIRGDNNLTSRLKFTPTNQITAGLTFQGALYPTNYGYYKSIMDMSIEVNSNCIKGFSLNRVAHGVVNRVTIGGASGQNLYVDGCVAYSFNDVSCSQSVGITGAVAPTNCIYITGSGGFTANSLNFTRLIAEGATDYGLVLTNGAARCSFLGGTVEACGKGICIAGASQGNSFISMDCEANSGDDYTLDSLANGNTFICPLGTTKLVNNGSANTFIGGAFGSVFFNTNSAGNVVIGTYWNLNTTDTWTNRGSDNIYLPKVNASSNEREFLLPVSATPIFKSPLEIINSDGDTNYNISLKARVVRAGAVSWDLINYNGGTSSTNLTLGFFGNVGVGYPSVDDGTSAAKLAINGGVGIGTTNNPGFGNLTVTGAITANTVGIPGGDVQGQINQSITNIISSGGGFPLHNGISLRTILANTITNGAGINISSNASLITISSSSLTNLIGGTNITVVSNTPGSFTINYTPVTNCTTIAISDTTSSLSSGAGKQYWNAPYNATLKDIRATLYTVSSSGIVTINIKKNGTTIFTTKLTIDASEETSDTAATPYVFSTTAITKGDKLTFDIDGAGTGAVNLQVQLYYTK